MNFRYKLTYNVVVSYRTNRANDIRFIIVNYGSNSQSMEHGENVCNVCTTVFPLFPQNILLPTGT